MKANELVRMLSNVENLEELRVQAPRVLTEKCDVMTRLAVAARVCKLVCDGIHELWQRDPEGRTGAVRDTLLCRGCHGATRETSRSGGNETWLSELMPVASKVSEYLTVLGEFQRFASLVSELVEASMFAQDGEDLIIHRSLFAWHAVMETYMRMLQGEVVPSHRQNGHNASRYDKGDAKDAVVRTALGPVIGHHQLIALTCATFSDSGMSPREAFMTYRENMVWVHDWATAHRADGGIVQELFDAFNMTSAVTEEHRCGPRVRGYVWEERNYFGERFTAWLARLDHTTRATSQAFLLHTGVLCRASEPIREMTMVCVSYGSYGFWGMRRELHGTDSLKFVCACIGEMLRGWAIDHDTEAAVSEHSLLNWLCVACATRSSQEALSPINAAAEREDWEMRIAWGPQTYFFFDIRHHGLMRRMDNLRALQAGQPDSDVHFAAAPRTCDPIKSGDTVPTMVTKLLALSGLSLTTDGSGRGLDLDPARWECHPRICPECSFEGDREQLFMISLGCARLAAALPEGQRRRFALLVEKYGFRLFPAVQVRLLVQCDCVPRWTADVMSSGYRDAWTACGQNACLLTGADASAPPPATDGASLDEDDEYGGELLHKVLLRQAHAEARQYATRTGRRDWLDVVSAPISALDYEERTRGCTFAESP